jgi:hypothetical protein
VPLLPYIEQNVLYGTIDRSAGWDAPANATAVRMSLAVLRCPDWTRESAPVPDDFTAYLGCAGVGAAAAELPAGDRNAGVFGYDRRTAPGAIKDGASQTLLVLESARDNGPWARGGPGTVRGFDPADRPYLGTGRPFGGTHFAENLVIRRGRSTGCNTALADGSVRWFTNDTSSDVLEAMATVAGGEEVTVP